jgi:hypothetical protein
LWLTLHNERQAWKGFDWAVLGRHQMRRKEEPLLPDREGAAAQIATLREIDAYNFRAQYLQRPTQAPGLERVGWFWAPRPPGWQPGMPTGGGAFSKVREMGTILYEAFGLSLSHEPSLLINIFPAVNGGDFRRSRDLVQLTLHRAADAHPPRPATVCSTAVRC